MTVNKCEGRPKGPCPLGKCDSSVKFSTYDLFLCSECVKYRESEASMSDNTGHNGVSAAFKADHQPTKCELLCFIQDKSKSFTFDQLSKICLDFYREEEIMGAKSLLDQVVSTRLPKRQGSNKMRLTLEDILKVALEPTARLPLYYASNLARLPPVDVSHCDVSAILRELQALRQEVRLVADLRAEVVQLKERLLKQEGDTQLLAKHQCAPTAAVAPGSTQNESVRAQHVSYSSIATNLVNSAINENSKKKTARPKPIVGKAQGFHLAKIDTVRKIDLFISRLPSDKTADEVAILSSNVLKLQVEAITAEQLKARYGGYSSFHITINVVTSCFAKTLEICNSEETWPEGILVRRFFHHHDSQQK